MSLYPALLSRTPFSVRITKDDRQKCADLEKLLTGDSYERMVPYVWHVLRTLSDPKGINHLAWREADESQRLSFFELVVSYFAADSSKTIAEFSRDQRTEISQIFPGRDSAGLKPLVLDSLWLWTMQVSLTYLETEEAKLSGLNRDQRLKGEFKPYNLRDFPQKGAAPEYNSLAAVRFSEVPARVLNAELLVTVGKIRIEWTKDIGAHLRLNEDSSPHTVSVFLLPCKFDFEPLSDSREGKLREWIPHEYTDEVLDSYWLLFGYDKASRKVLESELLQRRFQKEELEDSILKQRCLHTPIRLRAWTATKYQYLWPRIVALHNYLDSIQPEGLHEVMEDRRDQNRRWTLL